jgi:hypothetical protein
MGHMVWDVETRAQRNRAMTAVKQLGLPCDIPPRRLGYRFTFRVLDVEERRRREVEAAVLAVAPDATLQEE